MTVALGFLVFMLFLANTFQLASRKKILRELDGLKTEARAKALPTDDVEIKAYLEAQATTSALAKRLLAASSIEMLPGEPLPVDESWKHDVKAQVPGERFWDAIRREYACETDDASRVQCVRRWIEAGKQFTAHEKSLLLTEVSDSKYRDELRLILYPAKNEPKPPTISMASDFKWTRLKNVAVITVTCDHGLPAGEFTWQEDGKTFAVGCDAACRDKSKNFYPLDARFILVAPGPNGGTLWRCVDKNWIKAAL